MADKRNSNAFPEATDEEIAHQRPLTRRQVLWLGLGGGAFLIASNATATVVTQRVSTDIAEAKAATQLAATRAELEAQIQRLEGQLALYRDLERIGLDRLIHALLDAYDRLWPPIHARIAALQRGLQSIQETLTTFETTVATLRDAKGFLDKLFAGLEAQLQGVQQLLDEINKHAAPLGEAVGGFLTWLIDRFPFGVGANVRQANERLRDLVAAVPGLLSDARQRLLAPLWDDWLNPAESAGLRGRLFDPLRQLLLTPLATHLQEIDSLVSGWEESAKPLRAALAERENVRQQIAQGERDATLALNAK